MQGTGIDEHAGGGVDVHVAISLAGLQGGDAHGSGVGVVVQTGSRPAQVGITVVAVVAASPHVGEVPSLVGGHSLHLVRGQSRTFGVSYRCEGLVKGSEGGGEQVVVVDAGVDGRVPRCRTIGTAHVLGALREGGKVGGQSRIAVGESFALEVAHHAAECAGCTIAHAATGKAIVERTLQPTYQAAAVVIAHVHIYKGIALRNARTSFCHANETAVDGVVCEDGADDFSLHAAAAHLALAAHGQQSGIKSTIFDDAGFFQDHVVHVSIGTEVAEEAVRVVVGVGAGNEETTDGVSLSVEGTVEGVTLVLGDGGETLRRNGVAPQFKPSSVVQFDVRTEFHHLASEVVLVHALGGAVHNVRQGVELCGSGEGIGRGKAVFENFIVCLYGLRPASVQGDGFVDEAHAEVECLVEVSIGVPAFQRVALTLGGGQRQRAASERQEGDGGGNTIVYRDLHRGLLASERGVGTVLVTPSALKALDGSGIVQFVHKLLALHLGGVTAEGIVLRILLPHGVLVAVHVGAVVAVGVDKGKGVAVAGGHFATEPAANDLRARRSVLANEAVVDLGGGVACHHCEVLAGVRPRASHDAAVSFAAVHHARGPALRDGARTLSAGVVLQIGASHQNAHIFAAAHPSVHHAEAADDGARAQHAEETGIRACVAVNIQVLHGV